MKVAIMQPYFIPYAGYFRLFSTTDLFVVYDCVQFPRRSWVHRNKLYTQSQELDWLTLPLQKQPVDTTIKQLAFRDQITDEWQATLARFPGMKILQEKYPTLYQNIITIDTTPLSYIVRCLREICSILEIPFNITYSSTLNLPADIKGQQRILSILDHYQATDYVNSPGGRDLYQESEFERHGRKLHFLPAFKGELYSVIQYLTALTPTQLRELLAS